MLLRTLQFLAVILTALALIPGGAHFFELPNKIGLSQEQYFTVQAIYRGWALFGIVLFAALAADLALVILLRRQPLPFWLTVYAFVAMVVSLVVFFIFTYPTNVATHNWTMIVDDWQVLRTRWEYSHAVNAMITFSSLCAQVLAVMTTRPAPP
jgi:hypothetical protein